MHRLFVFFFGSLLYMEAVYHISVYGLIGSNPIMLIPAAVMIAGLETCLVRLTNKRGVNLAIAWVCMSVNYLLYAVQQVYQEVFGRPLMFGQAAAMGGDALTTYWKETLMAILSSVIPLIFLAVPFGVAGALMHFDILKFKQYRIKDIALSLGYSVIGVSLTAFLLLVNFNSKSDFYSEYQEVVAPELVVRDYGMLPLYERQVLGETLPEMEIEIGGFVDPFAPSGNPDTGASGDTSTDETNTTEPESTEPEPTEPPIDTSPNVFNIDFDKLMADGNKNIDTMASIMQSITASKKNEYTGMFEGYNLIYITAEAFSKYVVSEELTPTLYKMMTNGVVVEDYYVPTWYGSTTSGEYVNMFGQFPDSNSATSFEDSLNNTYPYALPAYFAQEGVKSFAYHNNSISYYKRYLTHPHLGYDFMAATIGKSSLQEKYGHMVYEMEHPKYWPQSDYEMMVATIPKYINEDRFHVAYMTVSGHLQYNFTGNRMAKNNKAVVEHLPYSEKTKAYIACNYELEKAMTYLVEELEKAGKLDNTVIVLSADHAPYGLGNDSEILACYKEITGQDMSGLDVYSNCLIMWNSAMENIVVDKTCSSIDIMPTILNLFGFEYDSRLYPGKDMLSDSPSFVTFQDGSFITDYVIYNKSANKVIQRTDTPVSNDYVSNMKSYVKTMRKYSNGMLNYDFHNVVSKYVIQEPTETVE